MCRWMRRSLGVVCLAGVVLGLRADPPADYRIAPSDVLTVTLLGEKDWDKIEQRVTSSGTISLPFVKEVSVKGLTTAEVVHLLQDLLKKDYFVDPQVVASVKEYSRRTVTVIGQVTKQGVIPFPNEQAMNILEAIGAAEGFTKAAKTSRISVTRHGQTLSFNLDDWQKKPDRQKPMMLEPGDVVFVPESLL